jgi:hypothetical protein
VPLFVLYALASGGYSYLLLLLFVRFSYNVFFHWFAELALVPAALLAFVIFRSRLRSLQSFALGFYRTKAGALRLTPLRATLAIAALVILFVPIVRDRENAYFVIEPRESHQVHAGVPGKVLAVYVKEGDAVRSRAASSSATSNSHISSSKRTPAWGSRIASWAVTLCASSCCGRCSRPMVEPGTMITSRWIRFSSSRTLPGQECSSSAARASGVRRFWKRRMASTEGQDIYKERAATSETVNADLRSYRGLTPLTVRGLSKITCVTIWCALAYNLMHFATALLS